jgi:hypothetical protein
LTFSLSPGMPQLHHILQRIGSCNYNPGEESCSYGVCNSIKLRHLNMK